MRLLEGKAMRGAQIGVLILALVVAGCSGGAGDRERSTPPAVDTSPPPPPPPPVVSDFVLQYPGPQVFTVNIAASSDVPYLTQTGATSISASPPLPDGLAINADTGVISGIPTAVTPAASYTFSVFNDLGESAKASVIIEVNEGPFFYSSPTILAIGSAMTPLSPRGASGTASYSVTPPLPSGLAIDPVSGVISGTPTSPQPATYYQVSRAESLLTLKFGLTLGIGASPQGAIAVSNTSTLSCAYSGGFIGTYIGNSANDEGLIAIAFTPDGNALARVLDLSDNAVYDSDGLPGLSAALDGSFDIHLPVPSGAPAREIRGNFSGADLISGTYESGGIAKAFKASRLAGSPLARVRYTGGFGSANVYRVDFGVLDLIGTAGVGIGYQFEGVGSDYRLINRQLAIQGSFSGDTFTWKIPDDDIAGVDSQSSTGFKLAFGDPYDGLFFARTLGCQLN
jgi:hypothetical protein